MKGSHLSDIFLNIYFLQLRIYIFSDCQHCTHLIIMLQIVVQNFVNTLTFSRFLIILFIAVLGIPRFIIIKPSKYTFTLSLNKCE